MDAAAFVVRVWLPDRPGALGQVASRIGAVRGDVVGIEILERGGGSAIDELVVSLPDAGLVDLLVTEILQVDGVAVEDVRRVDSRRLDAGTAALDLVHRVLRAAPDDRLGALCAGLVDLVDGDWAALVRGGLVAESAGPRAVPDAEWLHAFVVGASHLGGDDHAPAHAPGDVVWAALEHVGATLVCGREGRVFHGRERQQVQLLGSIVDAAAGAAVLPPTSDVAEVAGG